MTQGSIPGNTPAVACMLCERWARTPFAKRHTTPTTAQDTETAMVLGYWIASRRNTDVVARMCERHSVYLFQLDTIEGARTAQADAQAFEQSQGQQDQRLEFERRAYEVTRRLSAPLATGPAAAPLTPGAGLLGLEPVLVPSGVVEPKLAHLAPGQPFTPTPPVSPSAVPAEVIAEGAKPTFPCPLCGKIVTSGAVHDCA